MGAPTPLHPDNEHGAHRRFTQLTLGVDRDSATVALDFYALGIDVLQAYGLTETTGAAFANSPHNNVIGSVGPPFVT